MKTTLKPLGDKVIVKRVEAETKTKGGIIIPESAKEKPLEGEIIAVGGGALTSEGKLIPMNVKVGEIAIFPKWGGSEIKIDGVEYIIIKENDILAIKSTN